MMGEQERYDQEMARRITKLEGQMEDLTKWKSFLLGAAGAVGLFVGAYAKQVALIVRSILS